MLYIQETLVNPEKCKTENYTMTRNHGEKFLPTKTVDFHEETYSAFLWFEREEFNFEQSFSLFVLAEYQVNGMSDTNLIR